MEKNEFIKTRLLSLDFFRGVTMFLLIAEFTHLFGYLMAPEFEGTFIHAIGEQLHHKSWEGLHFWDLIQPFFMFIVGTAMPLSYAKRIGKGESHQHIFRHILKRSLLLLVLGWWLYCINAGQIAFFFQNVLAQLAVTILISFLVMRKSTTTQLLVTAGLLLFTELLYRGFWLEGFNQPFVPNHNFGTWFDSLYGGEDLGGHWASFNAIPTTAHTIWGVLAGRLLMSNKPANGKLKALFIAGAVGLILGYGLSPVTPIIKRIATSTFVLASGGWALIGLAVCYWLIDIMKWQKGVLFFGVVGMNPLFIYLFAHVGGAQLINKIVFPLTNTSLAWAGSLSVNLASASITTFLLWYICYWMYQQKIFIKI